MKYQHLFLHIYYKYLFEFAKLDVKKVIPGMELLWSPIAREEFQKSKHHREDGAAHLSRTLELDIQEYQPNCDLQILEDLIAFSINQLSLNPPPPFYNLR